MDGEGPEPQRVPHRTGRRRVPRRRLIAAAAGLIVVAAGLPAVIVAHSLDKRLEARPNPGVPVVAPPAAE